MDLDPIPAEEAEDHVYGDHVAVQDVSSHRWYTRQLVVYQDTRDADGALRGFYYLDPASELQEDQERFEDDPVPTFAVNAKQVVTTQYEPA